MFTNACSPDTFVLLDDQTAEPGVRSSRLYESPVRCMAIRSADDLPVALEQMQQALADGLYAVLLLNYELGEELQAVSQLQPTAQQSQGQILLFESVRHLLGAEVDQWLSQQTTGAAVLSDWSNDIDRAHYAQMIDRTQQYIASGDTYQVNLCYLIDFAMRDDPVALYQQLREQQSVPYGALIRFGFDQWILSRSPELFVEHRDGWIEARPMKGTAQAGGTLDLALDPKNRAENVMIVDLLRNDLGRLAKPGSVKVPQKFQVHRYGDVLQMTSTIRAQLREGLDWLELLRAIFPCGSITGAPKRRTMQIIRQLEGRPRGLYTGAIGWADPVSNGHQGLGSFCLSVPIRTMTLSEPRIDGSRHGVLGVGAGITWDSRANEEWEECQLKTRFVHRLVTDVTLFETMRASRSGGIAHLQRHLARLQRSAHALRYTCDVSSIEQALHAVCGQLEGGGDYRVRLDLKPGGQTNIQVAPLTAIETPVRIMLAADTTDSGDVFLQHKTSKRARYDAAWQYAQDHGAFDMLFFNERGELTEGGRSNVFIKIDGQWYTPPLSCGVLPGIMRSVLLDDPAFAATEKTLFKRDLLGAQAVILCNALRGAMAVQWGNDAAPLDQRSIC